MLGQTVTPKGQGLHRIIVVLEKVPHTDQVKAQIPKILLVKQTASKVDLVDPWQM